MERKHLGVAIWYLVKYLNIFLKIMKTKLKWETHLFPQQEGKTSQSTNEDRILSSLRI